MKISLKKNDIFNIFLLKISIGCGYTLECPWQGGSNEYPQPMFWIKNKKNRHTSVNPSFLYKSRVYISQTCFPVMVVHVCFNNHNNHYSFIHLSRIVRKPDFCLGENKGADQLRGNREADQRLCFHYTDSTISLLLKSEISSF